MNPWDIVTLGEVLIDFTPVPNQPLTYTQNPGGAPANVLVAAQRLKKQTAFIGMVGRDAFGTFLRQILDDEGVNTEGLISTDQAPTTLAFVHLGENGERSFTFIRNPGADLLLTPEAVNLDILRAARIFHFGSISMTGEPVRAATRFAIEQAKQAGCCLSFDPNWRPALWESPELGLEQMRWGVEHAQIVKVSDEELEMLTNTSELDRGALCLLDMGPSIVMVTLGRDGCVLFTREGSVRVPSYVVKPVDTTGCGDAFMGAMLAQLADHLREQDTLPPLDVLSKMARFANGAGALCATERGAMAALPTLDALTAFCNAAQ